nr:MAG: hypothetical protein [Bacteriophage sp.]
MQPQVGRTCATHFFLLFFFLFIFIIIII